MIQVVVLNGGSRGHWMEGTLMNERGKKTPRYPSQEMTDMALIRYNRRSSVAHATGVDRIRLFADGEPYGRMPTDRAAPSVQLQ